MAWKTHLIGALAMLLAVTALRPYVAGIGEHSCAEYLATQPDAHDRPSAYTNWIAGYVRGVDEVGAVGPQAIAVEEARVRQTLAPYCRVDPEATMAEVVQALEGDIAPIECITEGADGSLVCVRESAADGDPCPTKFLWTRVQGSIVRTLNEMTLDDLVRGPSGKQKEAATV